MPALPEATPPATTARGFGRRRLLLYEPPSRFSLRSNYQEVINYLQHLTHQIYNRTTLGQGIGVEFRALREVSPGAGLLLAAELDRWQRHIGYRLRAVRPDEWNPVVAAQLRELGLFELLNIDTPDAVMARRLSNETTFIRYTTGVQVSGDQCAQVLDHLAEIAGTINAETFIYDGLVEAIKNVKHHAYGLDPNRWYGVPDGTWWMCGAYLPSEGQLTVTVYDMGVGIPQTLPRSTVWEHVRPFLNLLGSSDDASMIAAAMQAGRTRTRQSERGKGLPIMMRLFDHHQGHLRILSGRGEATYRGPEAGIARQTHTLPISGTLIEWHVRQQEEPGEV